MKRITLGMIAGSMLILAISSRAAASPELSAADIVAKNAAARGGLEAWRRIRTVVWIGHVESPDAPMPKLPFVLEMKRPNKSRFQIEAQNQISINLFSGTRGWKLRAARDGQPQMQPYTSEEIRFAQDGPGIDGPLLDYEAKGISVALDGSDNVEGRKAYRLRVTLPSGATHHVWVDATSFLEIKYDRETRNALGQPGMVSVYYRDYRAIEGVQMPFTIQTTANAGKASDKMVIDKIMLNPPLEDRIFEAPLLPAQHRSMASIDTTRPEAGQQSWPVPSLPPASSPATSKGR